MSSSVEAHVVSDVPSAGLQFQRRRKLVGDLAKAGDILLWRQIIEEIQARFHEAAWRNVHRIQLIECADDPLELPGVRREQVELLGVDLFSGAPLISNA